MRAKQIPSAYDRPASRPQSVTPTLTDSVQLDTHTSDEGGFFKRFGRALGFGSKQPEFHPLQATERKFGFHKLSPELRQLVVRDDARAPEWLSQKDWRIADTGRVVHDDRSSSEATSTELRTPPIPLNDFNDATLETDFQYGRLEHDYLDSVHLEMRSSQGKWRPIVARESSSDGQKVRLSYDLSEHLGDTVEFRFRLETEPGLRFPFLGIDRFTIRADDQVLFRSGRADLKKLPAGDLASLHQSFEALGDLYEASELVGEVGKDVKPCHLEAVRRYGPDVCQGMALLDEPEVSVHSLGIVTQVERRLPEPAPAEETTQVRSWLAAASKGQADEALNQLKKASRRIDPPRFWRLLTHLSNKTDPIQWSQFPAMVDGMLMGDERSVDSVMLEHQEVNYEEDFLVVGDISVERRA